MHLPTLVQLHNFGMEFSVSNIGILVSVLVFALWYVGESIRIARFKKQHGCQPVCKISQSERVIGFGLYRTQINASKEGTILELAQGRYDTYGLTWQASMMGQVRTNNSDPERIIADFFKDIYQHYRHREHQNDSGKQLQRIRTRPEVRGLWTHVRTGYFHYW